MSESQSLGQMGELRAAEYLQHSGYKILHRNWKSGQKEIDIVAENSDVVVFVEVKTRIGSFLSNQDETIPKKKQNLTILAAESFINRYGIDKEARFDVIMITFIGTRFEINHIERAFYPTLR